MACENADLTPPCLRMSTERRSNLARAKQPPTRGGARNEYLDTLPDEVLQILCRDSVIFDVVWNSVMLLVYGYILIT